MSRRFPALAITLATRLAPATRRGWLAAMAHEIDHLPACERRGFAVGCLTTALRTRIAHMTTDLAWLRPLAIAGACALAAIAAVQTYALGATDPAVTAIFALWSAFWVGAAAALLRGSPGQAALVGCGGIAVATFIQLGVWGGVSAFELNAEFLSALAMESVALCALLIAAAGWMRQRAAPAA